MKKIFCQFDCLCYSLPLQFLLKIFWISMRKHFIWYLVQAFVGYSWRRKWLSVDKKVQPTSKSTSASASEWGWEDEEPEECKLKNLESNSKQITFAKIWSVRSAKKNNNSVLGLWSSWSKAQALALARAL